MRHPDTTTSYSLEVPILSDLASSGFDIPLPVPYILAQDKFRQALHAPPPLQVPSTSFGASTPSFDGCMFQQNTGVEVAPFGVKGKTGDGMECVHAHPSNAAKTTAIGALRNAYAESQVSTASCKDRLSRGFNNLATPSQLSRGTQHPDPEIRAVLAFHNGIWLEGCHM